MDKLGSVSEDDLKSALMLDHQTTGKQGSKSWDYNGQVSLHCTLLSLPRCIAAVRRRTKNASASVAASLRAQRPVELFMCSVLKETGYGDGFRWLARHI